MTNRDDAGEAQAETAALDAIRERRAIKIAELLYLSGDVWIALCHLRNETAKGKREFSNLALRRVAQDKKFGPYVGRSVVTYLVGDEPSDEENIGIIVDLKRIAETKELVERIRSILRATSDSDLKPLENVSIRGQRRSENGLKPAIRQAAPFDQPVEAAIKLLLNLSGEYLVPKGLSGKYFGYRRSSSKGQIIRYWLEIFPAPDKQPYFQFENVFRGEKSNWTTRGYGFAISNIVYFIGHATLPVAKGRTERASLGLRFFSLVGYRKFGWFHGLVSSTTDRGHMPISARTVLVPAECHARYVLAEEENTVDQTIKKMIEVRPKADEIEKDISFIDERDVLQLGGDSGENAAIHIQALLSNATLTTLRADRPNAMDESREEIELLIGLQDEIAEQARRAKLSPVIYLSRLLKRTEKATSKKRQRKR